MKCFGQSLRNALLCSIASLGFASAAHAHEFIVSCNSEDDGDLVARVVANPEHEGTWLQFNGPIGIMPKSRVAVSGYLVVQNVSDGMLRYDQVSIYLTNPRTGQMAGATTAGGIRGAANAFPLNIHAPLSVVADPEGIFCSVIGKFSEEK